jgi:membrane protease subunit HflK
MDVGGHENKGQIMPWTNQGGGKGPWGQGPRGGGGDDGGREPPDFEDMIRRGQERMKSMLPGGFGNRGFVLIAGVIFLLWLASGFYSVESYEQGVVLRFGDLVRVEPPGFRYALPYPIEEVMTPPVTTQRVLNIGMRTAPSTRLNSGDTGTRNDVPEESLMLTGDENIVDIDFSVIWYVKNAADYLFNVQDADGTVKAVAEAAMREVTGRSELEPLLTQQREQIAEDVKHRMQQVLDEYRSGILVHQVQSQSVDPPSAVIDSFRDVQAAQADKERIENEALAYKNDVEPKARGEAQKVLQEAQAYMEQSIAQAKGESARFTAIREEYARAPQVTRERIFLETMERVLGDMDKVIIDNGRNGANVIPYLPLPELQKRQPAPKESPNE